MDTAGPKLRSAPGASGSNPLYLRLLEEVTKFVPPERAKALVSTLVSQAGADPGTVTLGHLVRAMDLLLPTVLPQYCDAAESNAIGEAMTQLLDQLAGHYFGG